MRENKDMRSAGNRLWPPVWPEITLAELRGRAEVRGGHLPLCLASSQLC